MNNYPNHYLAVVLDDESVQRLLQQHPPLLPEVKAHHVTIERNVTAESLKLLGTRPNVTVRSHVADKRVQVVLVSLGGHVTRADFTRHAPRYHHITISHEKGVRASASNELLEHHFNQLDVAMNIRLYGTVRLLEKGPE